MSESGLLRDNSKKIFNKVTKNSEILLWECFQVFNFIQDLSHQWLYSLAASLCLHQHTQRPGVFKSATAKKGKLQFQAPDKISFAQSERDTQILNLRLTQRV